MPFTNKKQNTNLREFRQYVGDGARPYLFEIDIPTISIAGVDDTRTITCLARTANLPRYTIEDVPFEFQKSTFHMGGRAKFDTWQVTFMADVYHKLRNRLLAWQSVIFDPSRQVGYSPSSYKRDDVTIKQLDRIGSVVTAYTFMGLFPSEVGEIQMDQGNTAIEEFNVTFTYDYYVMGSVVPTEVKYPDWQTASDLNVGNDMQEHIYADGTGDKYDATNTDVNGYNDNGSDAQTSGDTTDGTNQQVVTGGKLSNMFGSRGPIGFATPPTAKPSTPSGGGDVSQQEVDLSIPTNPGFGQPYGKGGLNTPDSSNRETLLGNVLSFNPYNALGVPYSYRWMPPVKGLASIKVSRKGIG
jgi:hypothetical protein